VKHIKVYIISAKDSDPKHAAAAKAWYKDGLEDLDAKNFVDVMTEVNFPFQYRMKISLS